jgi:thiol-disulfide isomerase/thioredoxin
MSNRIITIISLVSISQSISNCGAIKSIQDDDLMNLIRTETYVIALFSSKNCEACDNFESVLNNLQKELANNFNGETVKVINSQLTRLYSPTKEPVLVFFRHGIPLLYNDVPSEDLILHTFVSNKDPVVKELNDETFEHLTQAATGATTGDWFVMFYSADCADCHRLQARWESVGAKLKTRMNVARVNKGTDGSATASRFGVSQVPAFILFRHGKMYRYQIQKYDIESFVSFAQDWFKNMKPERVAVPKSPFDEVVENVVTSLRENTLLWQTSLLLSLLGFVVFVWIKYRKGTQKEKPTTKKGDKEK